MSWDWEKLKEQQDKRGDFPPQLDDLFKKLKKINFPGGLAVILIVIIFFFGFTMVYKVEVDEVGVVQRFGKYVRKEYPGLRIKLPVGIEKVTKVKVERVYKQEFGFFSLQQSEGNPYTSEADSDVVLMLTGDLNVVLVPWIVQYKIHDPVEYLFKVASVEQLLRDMSEAAMRLVVGDRSVNEVISKREAIAEEAKIVLQTEMDNAETGIRIVTIEMKRTNVPDPVQPSFNEVNQAIQEKEKMIYQANEEYNKSIPAARGEAEKILKTAEGYKYDRVNRAKGDAARFTSLYEAYATAKDVTKKRLYIEMMKEIFSKVERKYIIDSDQKNLLPLLNLGRQNEAEK